MTNQMDASNDRKAVEQEADYEILGVNAIQQTSKMARQGDVLGAQVYAKAQNRRLRTNATTGNQQQ
jgi:hypothetical protein